MTSVPSAPTGEYVGANSAAYSFDEDGSSVGASRRLYKACRTCRKQKMRCDGNVPCQRCRRAEVACVFDKATGRRPRGDAEGSNEQRVLDALCKEVAVLKSQMESLQTSQNPALPPPAPSSTRFEPRMRSEEIPSPATTDSPALANGDHLVPSDLGVPVTTVHVLMHPSPAGEAQRNARGWTAENQSKWNREDREQTAVHRDALARSAIDQPDARGLFDSFMGGANAFLHIFDNALDTFDAVRAQSSFAFTVMMHVAALQQPHSSSMRSFSETCLEESRRFAAQSLFENPASLETAEAMLTLAVYSYKTWFAVGHAFQMALDLGLNYSMQRIISDSGGVIERSKCTRYDSRCARTWLAMVYYERALAVGTARISRSELIDRADLQMYLDHRFSGPADLPLCAGIDLFQRCGRVQQQADELTLEEVEADLESWFSLWNARYDDHYIHAYSFHRVHLRIEMLYVRVVEVGIVTSRFMMARHAGHDVSANLESEDSRISKDCLKAIDDLLTYIENCEAYKQLFKWSPTFEALLLTYSVVLGFRMLRYYPSTEEKNCFLPQANRVAEMLRQHPCQRLYKVLRSLLQNASTDAESEESWPEEAFWNDNNGGYSVDLASIWQGAEWGLDVSPGGFLDMSFTNRSPTG